MIEILYFIPILLSAYVIGFNIFKFFKLKTTNLENSIFSIVLGFAFYSYLTFFLGILGWLYAWIYWIVILLSLIIWYKLWINFVKSIFKSIRNFKPKFNFETFLIVVIAIFVLLAVLSTLVPPFLWDEMDYRLAHPKIWARDHEIIFLPSRWISELPSNIDMLFIIGFLFKNGILSKFFALTLNLSLAAAVYSFGKRVYNKRVGLIASFIYLTLPLIMNHIGSAYVDISVAAIIFIAFYCLIIWIKENNIKWLYLSAIFTGYAAASKNTAIASGFIIGIFAMYYSFKRERILKAARQIFLFGLVILVFLLPWLAKTYYRTGNPVWPLAYNIFGGIYWDSNLASAFSQNLNIAPKLTFLNIFLAPWNLTMHSTSYSALLGWNAVFLSFVPILIFFRKIEKTTWHLILFSLLNFYLILYLSSNFSGTLRYMLMYSTLSILSAYVISKLYSLRFFKMFLILLLLITSIFSSVLWFGVFGQKMPYVFGIDNEGQYYAKLSNYNGYPVFEYINKNTPKNSIIGLWGDGRAVLSDRDIVMLRPLWEGYFNTTYLNSTNWENYYNNLRKKGVTHIFVNTNIETEKPNEYLNSTICPANTLSPNKVCPYSSENQKGMDSLLKEKGILLFENKGVYLYKLE